ncbi:MAG TPA: hypothetical protein VFS43_13150 [Polyangiaceae bacterium]|nr:hypothetical protein [Polyangiaceae bacterium]
MNPLLFRVLPRNAQRKLLLRYIRFNEEKLRDVKIYVAESRADVRAALTLVHDVYSAKGKIKTNAARLHVTKHNALPSTLIFIAKKGDRVIGTTSLVQDSPIGLPIDSMQRKGLDELRAQNLLLCEAVSTVCDEEYRGTGLIFYLYRAMMHTALRANFDRMVMSAQPKGMLIYEELLCCERFGELAYHPSFTNAQPSGALQLNLKTCEGRGYERFDGLAPYERTPHYIFYGKKVPQIELPEDLTVSAERLEASAALIKARFDLFRTLPRDERHYFRHVVPNVLWPVLSSMHIRSALPIRGAALPESVG